MLESSAVDSTSPKADSPQKRISTTPRSSVSSQSGLTTSGLLGSTTKRLSAAFKSPLRQNETVSGGTETVETLARDIEELKRKQERLEEQIDELHNQGYNENELKIRIECLHAYNEMKDVGQMLLGQLAVRQRVTTRDLYAQYSLGLED